MSKVIANLVDIIAQGHKLILVGRDIQTKERVVVKVKDFRPYFFVRAEERVPRSKHILEVIEGAYFTLDGKRLKKIVVDHPASVPVLRERFSESYESDIAYELRFRIDKNIKSGFVVPKDSLEVSHLEVSGFCGGSFVLKKVWIDVETVEEHVVCVGLYDGVKFKSYVFNPNVSKRTESFWYYSNADNQLKELEIYYFDSEREMLESLAKELRKYDVILGWNVKEFDMVVLLERAKELGLKPEIFSPVGIVRENEIRGLIVLDLLQAFKYTLKKEFRSYKLFIVAKEFGYNFIQHNPNKIPDWWQNDLLKLVFYNLSHVDATYYLDKHLGLSDFILEISYMAGCKVEDVFKVSRVVESYLLHFKPKFLILPRKPKEIEEADSYEGGLVVKPKRGLITNVMVFDLNRIYPSIIVAFNMSPETAIIDESGELKGFRKDKEGLIASMVKEMFELRERYKKDKLKYQAVKSIINAVYGSMGYRGFRLYKKCLAEKITEICRELLRHLIITVSQTHEVVYGDTDSLFVKAKKDPIAEGQTLLELLNYEAKQFVESLGGNPEYVSIDFEKVYSKAFFSVKKRYAGIKVWEEGSIVEPPELEVKGFEYIRSDSAKITVEVQKNVFDIIFSSKTTQEAYERVVKYLSDVISNFCNLPVNYIAIPKGLNKELEDYKKVPIHARACRYSIEHLGFDFKVGDKVYYVYVKVTDPNLPKTDVIAITEDTEELPNGIKVDYKTMIKKTVIDKVEPIFEALGWDVRVLYQRLTNTATLFDF